MTRSSASGFSEHPVLTPRGVLLIGRDDQRASLERSFEAGSVLTPTVRMLNDAEALKMAPCCARTMSPEPYGNRTRWTWMSTRSITAT